MLPLHIKKYHREFCSENVIYVEKFKDKYMKKDEKFDKDQNIEKDNEVLQDKTIRSRNIENDSLKQSLKKHENAC